MRQRLTLRIAAAVAVVAVILLGTIVVLALSASDLRSSSEAARETERTLQAANRVGSLVVDAETGVRGYAIAGRELFLEPLDKARREMPTATGELLDRPETGRDQAVLARSIAAGATDYVEDYAVPLARTLRTSRPDGRDIIVTAAGKRRVDAIRNDLERFNASVRAVALERGRVAHDHAERATVIAVVAGLVAIGLFVGLIVYLSASVAAPIRRAALAAAKLGGGDLGTRLDERRADEIGQLSDAFNAMGDDLQRTAIELENQHAELETQNGELERQAVELESQAVELEAQAAELEAGQHELLATNDSLIRQTASLEAATASLRAAKARVDQFAAVAEEFGRRSGLRDRADTLLGAVGDLNDAPVGALYTRPGHASDGLVVVSRRGLSDDVLGDGALRSESVAARALTERRTVTVAHGDGDLLVRSFGATVAVRQELHTPLLYGGDVLGVLSVGRTADRPFGDEEIQAIEHLVEQGAVAIANSLETERSRWLASLNRAVLDATADAINMVGSDGRRILANPEMDRFTEEILCPGCDLAALTPPQISETIAGRTADPDAYRARIGEILSDPLMEAVDEYELADTHRWIRRYTAPVHSREGELIGRIFVLSETTEQHETERIKDELMATVSHELRTPLSAILGFTELLMARDYGEEERKEYLATVHQQASRLSDLISDFLDLQRLEHSGEGLTTKPFDLRELLSSQVKLFSAQSQRHALELRGAHADLRIRGDADRLRRALANLLSNAIKYSPDGGPVTVEATRDGDDVTISVTDRGLGIPSDAQERIFERFYRVDNSATSRIGGTGLGLSLVREIARAHHGEVGFDSVEGQGSRFWIRVPVGGATPTPADPRDDQSTTSTPFQNAK